MVSYLLLLFASSAYLASQISASAFPPNPLLRLSARQDEPLNPSDIPPQCSNQCAAIVNTLNTCTIVTSCLCSTTVEATFVACIDCLASLNPTPDTIPTGQKAIDDYVALCASHNVNLPTPTVSIGKPPPPAATSGVSAKGPAASGALGFGVTAGSRLMYILVVLGGVSIVLL